MRQFAACAVAVLVAASAVPVRAAPTKSEDAQLQEAREHARKAKVHYDLGEYRQAAEEYTEVYRIKPLPAVLFNIAQAYRQARLYDKAKQFYRAYLRESPHAENRPAIERAIREIDELLAKEKKAHEAPPTGVTADDAAPAPADSGKSLPLPAGAPPAASAPVVAQQQPAPAAAKKVEPAVAKPAPTGKEVASTVSPWGTPAPAPKAAQPQVPPSARPATTRQQQVVSAESSPFYKKWWFWTAVGVVAVGGGAAAMTMGGNSPPAAQYGTAKVF